MTSVIFFIIALYLIYMNRGDKITQSIIPFIFISAITLFLTNYFQLKEENQNHSFFSTMVISNSRNLPYRVDYYNGTNSYMQRQEAYGLVSYALNEHSGFKNNEETNNNYICISLLQHKILNFLLTGTNNSLRIQKDSGVNILNKREAYFPEDLVNNDKILSYETVDAYISSASPNRIQRNMILVPKGTEIVESSKYLEEIKVFKKHYFEITIKSKFIHDSTDNHKVADVKSFNFEDEHHTKVLKTEIAVRFNKISSLSKKQDDYKKWVEYLINLIIEELDDSSSNDGKLYITQP